LKMIEMNKEKILQQYSLLSEYYDLLADKRKYQREVELIAKILSKYKVRKILDIGCGTGTHSILFAKKGFQVSGIDISQAMITHAKVNAEREGVKVNFFVEDMRNFNLREKFDACLYLHSFYYLTENSDIERALNSLIRHLKFNGIVVIFHYSVFNSVLSGSFQKTYLIKTAC